MTGRLSALELGALAVPALAVPVSVAAASDAVSLRPVIVVWMVGVGLTLVVALILWSRPCDRRIAVLLLALAAASAVRGLAASDIAWIFTPARALGQGAEVILVWVMLAFPSGRLRSRRDRWLIAASGLTATVLWIPILITSPGVPLAGPLVPCGSDCPTNLLFVVDAPGVARAFEVAFRLAGVALLGAVVYSLLRRLLAASPVVRRTLAPLLVVSILRVAAIAVFVGSGGAWLSNVVPTALFCAIPVAMLIGLLRARLYAADALLRLVSGLERRPGPDQLRAVMAGALDDPRLVIAYWLPDEERWTEPIAGVDGEPAEADRSARIVTDGSGTRLAAIGHDEALTELPGLVDAVTSSARMALGANRTLAELAGTDQRLADASSRARRDLEQDLHDGAQQRLIALRMKVSVLRRLLSEDTRRAAQLVAELGPDIDATLAEVRDVAAGSGPRLLVERGLEAAVTAAAERAPLPVVVHSAGVGRYATSIETAVYFVCSEALQNATKHCGPQGCVSINLVDDGCAVTVEVRDDGAGADLAVAPAGRGLSGMRRRMAACGGRIWVESSPGAGFSVRASVPRAAAG